MTFTDFYRLSAHAVITNASGEILQLKASYGEQSWGLPGGALDMGETVHQALIRECQEELGCEVKIEHLTGIYYYKAFNSHAFILSLLNQPSFYRYIADKGIYTEQQAEQYIQKAFIDGHQQQGFGPYIVANKHGDALGMVGLFQRDALAVPDIGFAFLEQYTWKGFAYEAAAKLLSVYEGKFPQIAAIADVDNSVSHGLLNKLGFTVCGKAVLNKDGTALVVFIRDSGH